jgi:hypothetical protein
MEKVDFAWGKVIFFTFNCECGLSGGINCTPEEAKEYVCPRCKLPIGRKITDDDRMALAARKWAKAEMEKEEK